jgi:hypothetical protein
MTLMLASSTPGGIGGGSGVGPIGALSLSAGLATIRADRSLRVIRRAQATSDDTQPSTSAYVRLWRTSGDSWGAATMLTVASHPEPTGAPVLTNFPIVASAPVPGFADWTPARIVGPLDDGATPLVRVAGIELWPTRPARRQLPTRWKRRERSRR